MIRLLALAGAAAAFAPTNLGARPAVALNAEMTKSKLTSMVQELTKENFDSIYEQEAWIVANGGSSIVKKTQRHIRQGRGERERRIRRIYWSTDATGSDDDIVV